MLNDQTQDVAKKISRKWWTIETSGEEESVKSVLEARYDDVDDNDENNVALQEFP